MTPFFLSPHFQKEFNEMLKKMLAGNMTLVDQIGSVQLAIQAAIRQAFKTPEVIRLFAKRQPDALRARLEDLKRDNRLGKIPDDAFGQQSSEIVAALKGLDEEVVICFCFFFFFFLHLMKWCAAHTRRAIDSR